MTKVTIDGKEYVQKDDTTNSNKIDGMFYAIVRSREQGVMCGFVESMNGRVVKLQKARQIYRYDSTFVLPDIAVHGMRDPEKAMLSLTMTEPMYMLEACGVIACSEFAANQLINIKAQSK